MKILQDINDKKIILNNGVDFKTDLGWEDNLSQYENDVFTKIINPIENYETIRYIHKPYPIPNNTLYNQTDIWFYFYFYSGNTHTNGLDYSLIGLTPKENAKMLKQSTESFFRLEFYKTPNDEQPDRTNRRLVMSKNLSLPLGEKYFYTPLNDYLFVPVFMGSNYRNKENMYFFWFMDDSAFNETNLTGNTFWMTARFFNALDGSIINFGNKSTINDGDVNESEDLYFKVVIDRTDYSYIIYRYNGTTGARIGISNDPIRFYEIE